jgi:hypothetical protein
MSPSFARVIIIIRMDYASLKVRMYIVHSVSSIVDRRTAIDLYIDP